MNQKRLVLVFFVLALLIAGWQAWVFFDKKRDSQSVQTEKFHQDPFASVVMPAKYDNDAATRAVIETKITATQSMYQEKPDIWETWIAIGNLFVVLEDYPHAIVAYERSLELQSNNILGHRNIAEVYNNNLREYDKAAAQYRMAIGNDFSEPYLYASLAFVQYKHLGNNEEAEKVYIEGLQKTGFHPELLLALIQFYKDTGNTEKYIENIKLLLERNPDNESYQEQYGKILKDLGVR